MHSLPGVIERGKATLLLKQKNTVYNLSDYSIYLSSINSHLKKMIGCYGNDFYQSKKGKIELTLITKVI